MNFYDFKCPVWKSQDIGMNMNNLSVINKHHHLSCKPFQSPLSHVAFLHSQDKNEIASMVSCLLQQEWHKYYTAG